MKRKKPLSIAGLLLSAFLVLTLSVMYAFAVPESPYIMVLPEATVDSTLTSGYYNISIYTNYPDSDIWQWQFELTFDPAVLQGVQVRNGDLITAAKDSSASFAAGEFDNTLGELSLTGALFANGGGTPFTTSGPGTLAYVDFTVIGRGCFYIELSDTTMLDDPDEAIPPPPLISALFHPNQIGHGFFNNKLTGDANGDGYVNALDVGKVNAHWAPAGGPPPWSLGYSRCVDCNDDGYINALDIGVINANWG